MVEQIFVSPQVKRTVIISNKLVHTRRITSWVAKQLKTQDLRKLRSIMKISKFIELLPCAEFSFRDEFFLSTSKNLLKSRNWTFPVMRYFTRKLIKYLWMIVPENSFLLLTLPRPFQFFFFNNFCNSKAFGTVLT